MKKFSGSQIRFCRVALLNALICVPFTTLAASNYFDARNDAMGGTGVASSNWGTAALANPALMTKAPVESHVDIILPSAGVQISDKDKMVDKIDDVVDTVDRYQDVINSLPTTSFTTRPTLASLAELQRLNAQVRVAAGDMADKLRDLRNNKSQGKAGAALAVTVPNETLPFAFVAKGYGTVSLSTDVNQGDIDYLQQIADGKRIPVRGDEDRLTSSATGLAAIVADYGIAMAHQFDVAGHPVSVGVTPKIQQSWLFNYKAAVYTYDKDDVTNNQYRKDDTGFNVDAGIATDVGENWTLGLSAQNLIARDIETKEVNGFKDTYQIRPLVTGGVSWHTDRLTTAFDVDMTPTKGFKTEGDSQYAGVGAEYRLFDWLQLRGGYRADMKSNDKNVVTGGFGLSPFNDSVHLDLAGSAGEDKTWGAMAKIGFTF